MTTADVVHQSIKFHALSRVGIWGILLTLCCCLHTCMGQYEDARCKCVCPDPNIVVHSNTTLPERKVYIKNVSPAECTCHSVVMSELEVYPEVKEVEFCPLCDCKYESRNTATIKVIVIIIIWIIAILVLYMIFLMVLDPILSKRKQDAYVEHTNEEEPQASTSEMPLRNRSGSNVFDRVGHQQVRWKQQVQEQRRNIYDRHVMLN